MRNVVERERDECTGQDEVERLRGNTVTSVSYTHLDVYKRQCSKYMKYNTGKTNYRNVTAVRTSKATVNITHLEKPEQNSIIP